MNAKPCSRGKVDSLFEKIVGLRFESYAEMERWFRHEQIQNFPN